jgi:hypothetical protein
MAIHVQDPETDRLLREFAKKRQVGLTAAIKLAVREADEAVERRMQGVRRNIEPLIEEVQSAMRKNKISAEDVRRFVDEGWDDL